MTNAARVGPVQATLNRRKGLEAPDLALEAREAQIGSLPAAELHAMAGEGVEAPLSLLPTEVVQ